MRSMVDAFVEMGMSEFDAWRCVHFMQGRASLVLVQVRPGAPAPDEGSPPEAEPEEVDVALKSGVAWARLPGGGWRYVRCVRWRMEDLDELREDLPRLSVAARD